MGIVRTVEWALVVPLDEAERRVSEALSAQGFQIEVAGGTIRGKARRALVKNRWAADVTVELAAAGAGRSRATCRVDMVGSKHYAVLDEIAEGVGDEAFDDRGLDDAVERLGKAGRLFGRNEVRHLRHLIRANERVFALAQGMYGGKQGVVVLTDERLFFFEKSFGRESLEEFGLASISSVEISKKLTGEKLTIHASGNRAEVKQVMHGQAEEVTRQFRALKERPHASVPPPSTSEPGVLEQIRTLGELRESGLLTADEFETKKTALLERL